MGVGAAIATGVAALVGGIVSAAGASASADEEQAQQDKLARMGQERFDKTLKQQEDEEEARKREFGLGYLADRRSQAKRDATRQRFKTDALKVMSGQQTAPQPAPQAQAPTGGLPTTTFAPPPASSTPAPAVAPKQMVGR